MVPIGAGAGVGVALLIAVHAAHQAQLVEQGQRAVDGHQPKGGIDGAATLIELLRAEAGVLCLEHLQHRQARPCEAVTGGAQGPGCGWQRVVHGASRS